MSAILYTCVILSSGLTFDMAADGDRYGITGGCNTFYVRKGANGLRASRTHIWCSDASQDRRISDLLQKTARIDNAAVYGDSGERLAECKRR